jgi:hypothetical protein
MSVQDIVHALSRSGTAITSREQADLRRYMATFVAATRHEGDRPDIAALDRTDLVRGAHPRRRAAVGPAAGHRPAPHPARGTRSTRRCDNDGEYEVLDRSVPGSLSP